jgi:uncharacterized damage-inducible protein DinB
LIQALIHGARLERNNVKRKQSILMLLLAANTLAFAQTSKPAPMISATLPGVGTIATQANGAAALEPQKEKHALQILLTLGQKVIISAADAMPADKYQFAPSDGEFKGVRTFGQQVKHLAATNHILAAAALGEAPPADAGDEVGPETVRTKAEILDYLNSSFAHLRKAVDAIGGTNTTVNSSPISPWKSGEATRLALIVESLVHAFDHYGQMVEYLRMNGVVPPASRP